MSLRSLLPPPPGPEANAKGRSELSDFWENPNFSTPENYSNGWNPKIWRFGKSLSFEKRDDENHGPAVSFRGSIIRVWDVCVHMYLMNDDTCK